MIGCAKSPGGVHGSGSVVTIVYGSLPPLTGDWEPVGVAVKGNPHEGATVWLRRGLSAALALSAAKAAASAVGSTAKAISTNPMNPCEGKPDHYKLATFTMFKGNTTAFLKCRGWNKILKQYEAEMRRMRTAAAKNVLRCIAQVLNWGTTKLVSTGMEYTLPIRGYAAEQVSIVVVRESDGEVVSAMSYQWTRCANLGT
jgi:hypothetical protein